MLGIVNRKNKINLADYSYKKDIANRLFLAELSPKQVEVLHELLFQPTRCTTRDIAPNVACRASELERILDSFCSFGLLSRQSDCLVIDKELRKFFEFHLVKFSENYEPSFEYLQGLLNKIPISILPTWYSIPRTSDNIFSSIVEKYLETPKIYENYLKELTFDDPIIGHIIDDVFAASDFMVETSEICSRYRLSKEALQEYLLLLEFHFVLVSRFYDGKEVIAPFYEWAEYLRFQKRHALIPIAKDAISNPTFAPILSTRKEQEDAMLSFRKTIDTWHPIWSEHVGSVEKSIYEIEKALRNVESESWILFDTFVEGLIAPIGQQPQVVLRRIGKKWRYLLPTYSEKEKAFIEKVIFELLHKIGITSIGTHKGKKAFLITPFGRIALGET